MLTATVVTLSGLVAVLAVLVVGLLRSHADILRRLHEMGAGVYDDTAPSPGPLPVDSGRRTTAAPPVPDSLSGHSPLGTAVTISLTGRAETTLLAFLSTGCTTCAEFWDVLDGNGATRLRHDGVRTVVVTRGSDRESPPEVAALAPADVPTVMSSEAWRSFGVPASPYFVLIDDTGAVAGEGTARSWQQVAGLIHRARRDDVVARTFR